MYTSWNEKMKCHTKHSISENLGVFCSSEMHMLSQGRWKLPHCPSITSNQVRIHKKLPQTDFTTNSGKTLDSSYHHYHKVKKFVTMQRFTGAGAFPTHSTLPTTDQPIWWPKFRNSWFRLNIFKSNNFSSACSSSWPQWNNIVTAEIKHSYTKKKKKSRDQSLFRRREFPQLRNMVFGVYTASNFYKLLQLQSMYYHSEVTLTSAKREQAHFQQLHHKEQQCDSSALVTPLVLLSLLGLQLLYSKPRDENQVLHWRLIMS